MSSNITEMPLYNKLTEDCKAKHGAVCVYVVSLVFHSNFKLVWREHREFPGRKVVVEKMDNTCL